MLKLSLKKAKITPISKWDIYQGNILYDDYLFLLEYNWFTMLLVLLYSKINQSYIHKKRNEVLVAHSCPTHCNLMECSSPGSSVHGILNVKILEWVVLPFSRGSSQPRNWTHVFPHCRQILYHLSHQKNSYIYIYPLFFRFFSHIGHYRVCRRVPCAIQ